MAKKTLGRHDDQRLAPAAQHLTSQEMEELRRRRRINHLHVVFGSELKESLESRAGMLWAGAFKAVW